MRCFLTASMTFASSKISYIFFAFSAACRRISSISPSLCIMNSFLRSSANASLCLKRSIVSRAACSAICLAVLTERHWVHCILDLLLLYYPLLFGHGSSGLLLPRAEGGSHPVFDCQHHPAFVQSGISANSIALTRSHAVVSRPTTFAKLASSCEGPLSQCALAPIGSCWCSRYFCFWMFASSLSFSTRARNRLFSSASAAFWARFSSSLAFFSSASLLLRSTSFWRRSSFCFCQRASQSSLLSKD